MSKFYTTITFHDDFFSFGIITYHSGLAGALKLKKNLLSTSQFLASQWDFMCPKCVHRLMNALLKSLVMIKWYHIMKNTNKWQNRKFCIFLFIICRVARHFVAVHKI